MAGFGPAPKAANQRRRRNLPMGGVLPTKLPSTGRSGPAPNWPLPKHPDTGARAAEREFWNRMWERPQALLWDQAQCYEIVGRYVRLSVEVNRGYAGPAMLAEVRQLEDRLGLSPQSMQRLRIIIEDDEAPARPNDKVLDIRERLKAVE